MLKGLVLCRTSPVLFFLLSWPQIEHKAPQLRHDVIEANFYSRTLANSFGMDVLDLHFHFRLSLHHRTSDGVHWNALAHRQITSLLLQHSAQAWGVIMPSQPRAGGEEECHTHWSKYKFLALTYDLMLLNFFKDLPSSTWLCCFREYWCHRLAESPCTFYQIFRYFYYTLFYFSFISNTVFKVYVKFTIDSIKCYFMLLSNWPLVKKKNPQNSYSLLSNCFIVARWLLDGWEAVFFGVFFFSLSLSSLSTMLFVL